MAVEAQLARDWQAGVAASLVDAGIAANVDRGRLIIPGIPLQCGRVRYSDGWSVSRMWVAPRRAALAITAQRMYYKPGSDERDVRPERQIIAGQRPPSRDVLAELAEQERLATALIEARSGAVRRMLEVSALVCNYQELRQVRIGEHTQAAPSRGLDRIYRQYGYDHVSPGSTLRVCAVDGVSAGCVGAIIQQGIRVARERRAQVAIEPIDLAHLENGCRKQAELGNTARKNLAVLLVMPSKKDAVSNRTNELMRAMDRVGLAFRRAYADDPHQYSIPNQFPSFIMACGGRAHRIAGPAEAMGIWMVGIDLSHPSAQARSRLAVTLVDPSGQLRGAWTVWQDKDETARAVSLARALKPCRALLARLQPEAKVLVVRDGRLFENEDAELYRDCLSPSMSLIEFRKYGNPLIVSEVEGRLVVPTPLAVQVPSANTLFVVTSPLADTGGLPVPAKVSWRREWNGLSLQPEQIAQLLIASSVSQTLGARHSSLPSPVYWADGIAAAGDEDLAFRGQRVTHLE